MCIMGVSMCYVKRISKENVLQQLVPDIIIITEYAGNYNITDIHTAQ